MYNIYVEVGPERHNLDDLLMSNNKLAVVVELACEGDIHPELRDNLRRQIIIERIL